MEITEHFIDVRKVFASKNATLLKIIPGFVIRYLKRIVHEDEVNGYIFKHRDKSGLPFVEAILREFGVRIQASGIQHLESGRYIIVANHQFQHDAVTLPTALGTLPLRGLMSQTELTDFRAPLAALAGIIAVHQDSHKTASLRLSIRALTEEPNMSLLVFPQGRLVRENTLTVDQFQDGVALVLKKVNQSAAKPAALLPVCISYQCQSSNPKNLPERLLYGWKRQWFGIATCGAVVSIGKPVLPDSYAREAVTESIFQSITAQCRLIEDLDEAQRIMEV